MKRVDTMKILIVADHELRELWDYWNTAGRRRTEGVELILSAGDVRPEYLEFLVTMLNVPCLYVRGNHDGLYDEKPPMGCTNIDGRVCDIKGVRIAGLGGSMRYRKGSDMYTEREMAWRVRKLTRRIRLGLFTDQDEKRYVSRGRAGGIEILLTHAPSYGHGDLEDLPHTGFRCFNRLIEDVRPQYHCYGHVHLEYGLIRRESEHPAGTHLINAGGMYILDI